MFPIPIYEILTGLAEASLSKIFRKLFTRRKCDDSRYLFIFANNLLPVT